jgi:hypothetical protein
MIISGKEITQILNEINLGSGDRLVWFTRAYHVGNGFWVCAAVWAPVFGRPDTELFWKPREPTPQELTALGQGRLKKVKRGLEILSKLHLFDTRDFYRELTEGGS